MFLNKFHINKCDLWKYSFVINPLEVDNKFGNEVFNKMLDKRKAIIVYHGLLLKLINKEIKRNASIKILFYIIQNISAREDNIIDIRYDYFFKKKMQLTVFYRGIKDLIDNNIIRRTGSNNKYYYNINMFSNYDIKLADSTNGHDNFIDEHLYTDKKIKTKIIGHNASEPIFRVSTIKMRTTKYIKIFNCDTKNGNYRLIYKIINSINFCNSITILAYIMLNIKINSIEPIRLHYKYFISNIYKNEFYEAIDDLEKNNIISYTGNDYYYYYNFDYFFNGSILKIEKDIFNSIIK